MRVSSLSCKKSFGKQPMDEAAHSDLISSCGSVEILAFHLISSPPGRSMLREFDLSLTVSNQTQCNNGFGHAVPQSLNEIILFPALVGTNMTCQSAT